MAINTYGIELRFGESADAVEKVVDITYFENEKIVTERKPKAYLERSYDMKIDFVIPWVDGSDPVWRKEKYKTNFSRCGMLLFYIHICFFCHKFTVFL